MALSVGKTTVVPSKELHLSKPTLIINDEKSEFGKYALAVVVLGIGSGYVWWKVRQPQPDHNFCISVPRWRFFDVMLSRKRALNGVSKTRRDVDAVVLESKVQLPDNLNSNIRHIELAVRDWETEIRRVKEKRGWRSMVSSVRRALNSAYSSVAQLVESVYPSDSGSDQRGDAASISSEISELRGDPGSISSEILSELRGDVDSGLQNYKNSTESKGSQAPSSQISSSSKKLFLLRD